MSDRDFDPVADAFRASLAYRLSRLIFERSSAAASESTLLNRWRVFERSFASLSRQRRIETIAIAIAFAALAHLAVRELLPRYATSGLPWSWNVAAAGCAAIVAILAGPIAAAAADSAPAKVWRQIRS